MKRLILILCLAIAGITVTAQTVKIDSFPVPAGTDTTVYRKFISSKPWGLNFSYKSFNAADAVLDLGVTITLDSIAFDRLDSSALPYTMADSTVSFEKMSFNFKYIAIKLTRNSVTAGKMLYFWKW